MSRVVRKYMQLHLAYIYVHGIPLEQLACHMRVASINTCVRLPLTLKIVIHDYLRFVKPLTITILTSQPPQPSKLPYFTKYK